MRPAPHPRSARHSEREPESAEPEPNSDPAAAAQAGGAAAIRVAVHTGSYGQAVVDQLNDDTYYNFTAVPVVGSQIDTAAELAAYDVVVIADYSRDADLAVFAPALRAWAEAGGGVVGTVWLIYAAGSATGTPVADIDAIIPVNTSVAYDSLYNPALTVQDATHPVTRGLTNFTVPSYVEYSTGGADAGAAVLATAGGRAAVVVGTPGGAGRSVWLGPIYMGGGSGLRAGNPDRLLEQAVAWAADAKDAADAYTFAAAAGDALLVTTTTPGDGPGEPGNDLAPVVELYDPAGVLVGSDAGGDPDGRNAALGYTVPAGAAGTYTVRVAPQTGAGAYTVRVAGATAAAATPFAVTTASLTDGAVFDAPPDYLYLGFSGALLLPTVADGDVLVNGVAARTVLLDGLTLLVPLYETVAADGTYTVTLPAGAVADLQGTPNGAFTLTFTVDTAGPVVTASSLTPGAVVGTSAFTYTATFGESLALGTAGGADPRFAAYVTGPGGILYATAAAYDPATRQLAADFDALPEGEYVLTLDAFALTDLAGNPLDGGPSFPLPSGQGDGSGEDFTVAFSVDAGTTPLAALTAVGPAGSLVYERTAARVFHAAGDIDSFTVELDAGQTATVVLTPLDAAVRGQVTLYGPGGAVVGTASAAGAGDRVVIQTAPAAAAGRYRIDAASLSGGGRYAVRLILNAAVENEAAGGGNDTPAAAEPLDGTAAALPAGATRLAVLGTTEAAAPDHYAFTLTAGQYTTLALGGAGAAVELLGPDGSVLARGTAAGAAGGQVVRGFIPAATGTYTARVTGPAGAAYQLVVTRGAEFNGGASFDSASAPDLTRPGLVLGRLDGGTLGAVSDGTPIGLGVDIQDGNPTRPYGWDVTRDGSISDGDNDAYDGGLVHSGFPSRPTGRSEAGGREIVIGPVAVGAVEVTRKVYIPADQGWARFLEIVTNPGTEPVTYTVPIDTNLGSDGGEQFIRTSGGDAVVNAADDWAITDDGDGFNDPTLIHLAAGPGARQRPATFVYGSGYVSYS